MNYQEFKTFIESKTMVDKVFYDGLVELYGSETVNNFFEQYINDSEVEDDVNKINRTSYYVEVTSNSLTDDELVNFDKINTESIVDVDSVRVYLKEIGNVPLLTAEEEVTMLTELQALTKEINLLGISIESVREDLEKLGHRWAAYNGVNSTGIANELYQLNKRIDAFEVKTEEDKNTLDGLNKALKELRLLHKHADITDRFINANLRLVVSIAKRYVGRGVEFLDLIQNGNMGLKKAVEKFEVEKGYKFSTYATWWIRQSITRSIADTGKTIRIPVHFHELINKVRCVESELETKLCRKPTDAELIKHFRDEAKRSLIAEGNAKPTETDIDEKCKINKKVLAEIKEFSQDLVSLSSPVGEEEDSLLGDFIPDESINVDKAAMQSVLKDSFAEILFELKKDKQTNFRAMLVILLRYGFEVGYYIDFNDFYTVLTDRATKKNPCLKFKYKNNEDKEVEKTIEFSTEQDIKNLYIYLSERPMAMTLEQVGSLLGVTRERIRQIEAKALRMLRHQSRSKRLRDFCDFTVSPAKVYK